MLVEIALLGERKTTIPAFERPVSAVGSDVVSYIANLPKLLVAVLVSTSKQVVKLAAGLVIFSFGLKVIIHLNNLRGFWSCLISLIGINLLVL